MLWFELFGLNFWCQSLSLLLMVVEKLDIFDQWPLTTALLKDLELGSFRGLQAYVYSVRATQLCSSLGINVDHIWAPVSFWFTVKIRRSSNYIFLYLKIKLELLIIHNLCRVHNLLLYYLIEGLINYAFNFGECDYWWTFAFYCS